MDFRSEFMSEVKFTIANERFLTAAKGDLPTVTLYLKLRSIPNVFIMTPDVNSGEISLVLPRRD